MKIGIPKEMANREYRVGMTHLGVKEAVSAGNEVYVSRGAGIPSGITDAMYEEAGAVLVEDARQVYDLADLIVKVKPPIDMELAWLQRKQVIFSYVLPERHKELCFTFIQKEITAFGYESVEDQEGHKPLLIPMSEIAGKMAVMLGSRFFHTTHGGKGLMLGCMPGISPAEVVILGAGAAAEGAAFVAAGIGCNVTILNRSMHRLRAMGQRLGRKATYLILTEENLAKALKMADMIINTIDQMGEKNTHLIPRDMLKEMKEGSIIFDVACDRNGTIETSRPTTHDDPIYFVDGIIHCAIPNLPGIVPRTATMALTEATLPYIMKLVEQGYRKAVLNDSGLRKGMCFYEGWLLHKKAAENFGLGYKPFESCFYPCK